MKSDFEVRVTPGRGEGVFANRFFARGEIVMVGIIKQFVSENNSYASQIAENVFAIHDGVIPKVNHSCEPNCGIHENASGAHDLISFRNIKPFRTCFYDLNRNRTVNVRN